MESITLKVDPAMARSMAKAMKHNYATKTEFIREAIRDKITKLEKEAALKKIEKYFGAGAHHKTTTQMEQKARAEISRKYAKKFGIELK